MSINKIRSFLYKSAKILGDVNAVKNGTIGKRIARRAAGKAAKQNIGQAVQVIYIENPLICFKM
ncbi:hypothetical protein QKW52_01455 [Bacillus sonorensis]|nr:hypothetical protein [Bacillus sonorensis]